MYALPQVTQGGNTACFCQSPTACMLWAIRPLLFFFIIIILLKWSFISLGSQLLICADDLQVLDLGKCLGSVETLELQELRIWPLCFQFSLCSPSL